MPVNPTYPGVYIEEIPSGVRTITGVSTSVTAFVGAAKSGTDNVAVHILSFADYERAFGGIASYSEMSFAVNQFFLNGGSDAWVIRLISSDAVPDTVTITDGAATPKNFLKIDALVKGESDRTIDVFIKSNSTNSTFTLVLVSTAQLNPTDIVAEKFDNLSMSKADTNYVETKVNGTSKFVTVKDLTDGSGGAGTLPPSTIPWHGTLTGAPIASITTITTLPKDNENSFRISLDGSTPDTIKFDASHTFASLDDAATLIQKQVRALRPADTQTYKYFSCTADNTAKTLTLTSGGYGKHSSVAVLAAAGDNLAKDLGLLATPSSGTPPLQPFRLTGGKGAPFNSAEVYNLFIADRSKRQGIFALDDVDLFNILCLPGITNRDVWAAAAAYCKERRAFLIIDAPRNSTDPTKGLTPDEMYTAMISGTPPIPKTEYSAIYYPWILVPDPTNKGQPRLSAPSGTLAGIYARTDSTRGVWKAPAGTDASLVGVQGAEYTLTDGQNGILNPVAVNCLRVFPVYGAVSWGSRTTRGENDYKYIPVRRLALYIEESLYRGTQWVVFEPNDEPLWAQIRLNVGAFMNNLFRQGAFQGQTPREAYLVKCDSETTTQNDINNGIVNIVVGFAPLKPVEFVIIQIKQLAGQIAS